jgi:hypothetical protein
MGIYTFSSTALKNEFKSAFITLGTVQSIGPNAVESTDSLGVSAAALINGVGINLSVDEPTTSAAVKTKDAKTVVMLIKALEKQV